MLCDAIPCYVILTMPCDVVIMLCDAATEHVLYSAMKVLYVAVKKMFCKLYGAFQCCMML
jgi:hypothetical protein